MSIDVPRRSWKPVILAAAITTIISTQQTGSAEEYKRTFCKDFNPSISYLNVALPDALVNPGQDTFTSWRNDPNASEVTKLNLPPAPLFSQLGIRYALVANFIQQMAIGALADEVALLPTLHLMKLSETVQDAMGFGIKGTRLREPGEQPTGFEQFSVEFVDVDDPWIQSDSSKTVFVTRGVVKNIVKSSINKSFGSIEAYEAFIRELLGVNATPGTAKDLTRTIRYRGDYLDPTIFPLGEVLSNASINDRSYFYKFAKFSEIMVGKFLFVGAHEIGHDKLNHRALEDTSCNEFRRVEREADEFAAKVLADFNFSMSPSEFHRDRLADFDPFFLEYREAGFSNKDLSTTCEYDSPEIRRRNVVAAYEQAVDELRATTFGGVDYTTPYPKDILCSDGKRE